MVIPVVLIVFLAFALLITQRPATVLAMAICVYPFEQWALANSAFFAVNSTLINIGFGALTLEALLVVVARGRNPLSPTTTAMGLWLALYILAGISCFWALDRTTSLFLFRHHMPYNITFVLLLPMVFNKPEDIRTGFIASLFFGTVVMGLLLTGTQVHAWGRTIEVAHGQGVVNATGVEQKRLGPLIIAEMCGQLILIASLMRFSGVNKIWGLLRWVVALMAMALIYRSGSRGQLIGALFALILFMPLSRGTKQITGWVATMVSLFLIGGIAVMAFSGVNDATNRWDLESMKSNFSSTRLELCVRLMEYWATSSPVNWLFGIGSSSSFDSRLLGIYCHVVFVEILGELGVVGLLLTIGLGYFVIRDCFALYGLVKEDKLERSTMVTLIAIALYQTLLACKQGSFLTNTFGFAIYLMVSRQTVVVRMAQQAARAVEWRKWWYAYQSQAAQQGGQLVS